MAEFYRDPSASDGLRSACKECRKKAKAAYRNSPHGKRTRERRRKARAAAGYWRYGKGAISVLRRSAKVRGLPFDLTAEQLSAWWRATPDVCEYCRQPIKEFVALRKRIIAYDGNNWEIKKFKRFFRNPQYATMRWLTIDRKDNAKGYSTGNMAKACWICNSLKHDFFSPRDMKKMAPAIVARLHAEFAKDSSPAAH